jgi:hypothetical protein
VMWRIAILHPAERTTDLGAAAQMSTLNAALRASPPLPTVSYRLTLGHLAHPPTLRRNSQGG